jgi:hypothetical protein
VHEQRQHRQDDADGRGQLEFAFEEHLIVSLLSAPSPDERTQGQQFTKKINTGLSQMLKQAATRKNKARHVVASIRNNACALPNYLS